MQILKTVGKMTAIVLTAMLFGTAVLTAAYCLPTEKMHRHVKSSIEIYRNGENAVEWAGDILQTRIDNFTDSLMLLKAIYPSDKTIFESMLLVPSWNFEKYGDPPVTLAKVLNNEILTIAESEQIFHNYPRYWHGYLALLKPALYLAHLSSIKMFNFYMQSFLLTATLFLIYKKLSIYHSFAFAIAMLSINPITVAICFQLSTIFYLILIGSIVMLTKNEFLLHGSNYIYFFVIVGIYTAFFDFLTYPVTAFGIFICLYVLLNNEEFLEGNISKFFKHAGIFFSSWLFGYGAMWFGKWLEVYLFTDFDIVNDVFNNARYRASKKVIGEIQGINAFGYEDVIHQNISTLFEGPLKLIIIALILIFLIMVITKKIKLSFKKNVSIIFLFVMAIPFLWYIAMSNHSFVHPFLAYRNLSVTIFGLGCLMIESAKNITPTTKNLGNVTKYKYEKNEFTKYTF